MPGDDSFDPLPTFMSDAITHDPNILPLMYELEIMVKMFPLIEAPVEIANDKDWTPGDCFWEQQDGDAPAGAGGGDCTVACKRRRGVLRQ